MNEMKIKTFAYILYVFAAAMLAIYFAAEIIPDFFLSTAGRLVFLCGCCVFLWLGGFVLTKITGSNKPMKINLWIFLGLYLLLFATLTLFDPMWGRNGGFDVLWTKELFEAYTENSLNLVPFRTIAEYFVKNDLRQFAVNIAGNIVCLMPLGILLPLLSKKQNRAPVFLATCTAIVVAVECLQFLTLAGSCDIDDVILNVAGAFLVFCVVQNAKINKALKFIFILEKDERK